MKTVAFLPGWSEGKWHTKTFARILELRGFKVIQDVSKSDAIVAHSLGTLLIPSEHHAKLIMLIGIPFWPGKSVTKSLRANLRHEATLEHGVKWWLRRSFWATLYVIRKVISTYKTLRRRSKLDFRLPQPTKDTKVLLIRNELDHFMHPDIQQLLPETRELKLINMPGGHESWWINPEKYVDLIIKELNSGD